MPKSQHFLSDATLELERRVKALEGFVATEVQKTDDSIILEIYSGILQAPISEELSLSEDQLLLLYGDLLALPQDTDIAPSQGVDVDTEEDMVSQLMATHADNGDIAAIENVMSVHLTGLFLSLYCHTLLLIPTTRISNGASTSPPRQSPSQCSPTRHYPRVGPRSTSLIRVPGPSRCHAYIHLCHYIPILGKVLRRACSSMGPLYPHALRRASVPRCSSLCSDDSSLCLADQCCAPVIRTRDGA